MTSIIKNQLLKHLSRYTKNLSSDKINLSTFRGEGELSNLELDEIVLTELLELPSWLKLTSAWCNHVAFRIHWTKLKSTPITLSLDEVRIIVEACSLGDREQPSDANLQTTLTGLQGKYSFINKVIDGITVLVNNVHVNFISPAFTASIQMSRIRVESRTPKWLSGDLRVTRLKDPSKGLILIFKELSWQTVRIEASSTQDKSLTPLRLLTNQARCRITIKKKLSDCSVLSSRLVLILDDLLWVLTDSQLKAALHFVDSLSGLIQASTNITQRKKAQRKLENLPEYQALLEQQSKPKEVNSTLSANQKIFSMYDVKETSYHFFSQRIDLHLCDDAGDGRSCHPTLKEGGALQISLQGYQVDYYPYHLAKANRLHWPKYKEANVPPALWLEQSLNTFKESLLNLSNPNRPSTHAPLERTQNVQQYMTPSSTAQTPLSPTKNSKFLNKSGTTTPNSQPSFPSSPTKKFVLDNLSKLMTSCLIIRMEDFTLYRVTTTGKKQTPKEFISGDKDRYSFPPELSAFHAEFTYFYYPGDFVFPLPPSKMFIYVNPVQITFDLESCLWFSSFALNLHESLLNTSVANSPSFGEQNEPSLMYMDIKLEAIMPRIVFETSQDTPQQKDRPKSMIIQISRFAVTNLREMGSSRADLAQALHALQEGSLVFSSEFPSKDNDLHVVSDRLLSHVSAADILPTPPLVSSPLSNSFSPLNNLTRYALWIEPRDIWCIKLDPIWIDFYGARSIGPNRSIPFMDAVPITFWIHGKNEFNGKKVAEQLAHLQQATRSSTSSNDLILDVNKLKSVDAYNGNSTNLLDKNVCLDFSILNLNENFIDEENASARNFCQSNKVPESENLFEDGADQNLADLYIITHVSNLVSIQIDHYQYLFLLRLSEELTELTTFLSLDSKRIMNKHHSEKSIVVGCVIPQVEVTFVMPSQTPGKELSGGDGESVLPDSASLGDDLHMNSTLTDLMDLVKNSNTNPFTSIESPSPLQNEPPFEISHTSNPNTHGYNVQILSDPIAYQTSNPATPSRFENVSKTTKTKTNDLNFSKEINSTMKSMKKGFSSFMTSFDATLKQTTDDISDTFSIHSDISSDSENFVMVLGDDKHVDCMDVMFRLNPLTNDSNLKATPVEMASEVYEEQPYRTNMSSPSEPSEASSCKRRDIVSMTTFRLTTVELIRQNIGYLSTLRVQISAVSCDECGAIPWDEFQSKFGTRCRAWNIAPYNPEAPPVIKLRLEEILNPPDDCSNILDRKCVHSWFSQDVEIHVKDLNLSLSMSTIIGLGDLAEDEVIPKVLPLKMFLDKLNLTLIEDRPPVNITSPGSLPIQLAIDKMLIRRDDSGVFNMQPQNPIFKDHSEKNLDINISKKEKDRDRELLSLQLVMQQLKLDNDNLRKQLHSYEKNNETNRQKIKQENDVLKTYLKAAQDDISILLEEKVTLLDTIRSLQSQLTTAENIYKTDGNR